MIIRNPKEYNFLEVPEIKPTEEEFNDPFSLISRLHKEGYMKHGIVKIIPPKSW